MHRVVSLLLGALLTLGLASSTQAGTLSIDFDFSQSSVSMLGGVIAVPPDGSISASTATVTVPADGLATPMAGAAALQNLGVTATIDTNILGQAAVTGAVLANQVGTATGSLLLTGGTGNASFPGFQLALDAAVNCTGANCSFIGTFPILSVSTQTFTALLPIAGIATPGAAAIDTAFSVTVGGVSALVTLVGSEVSRHYVPEPNSSVLLGGGLVALIALGRARLLRTAAGSRGDS